MAKFDPKEIENSNRIFKSATPKQDLSWYVKWISSTILLTGMSIRGLEGLQGAAFRGHRPSDELLGGDGQGQLPPCHGQSQTGGCGERDE